MLDSCITYKKVLLSRLLQYIHLKKMALFINNHNDLIVCLSDKMILFHAESSSTKEIHIPEIHIPHNLTQNQQNALKNEKATIITCAFSESGEFFAVTTSNKQLVIYDKDFNVLKNLVIARTASKVRFTTSEDIVVADKTGDVYFYKLKSDNCEPVQILGHLSMVLDVLTTKSDKYIVTCDRDEKIRVSAFPGGYNIVSFCLGHEEFVLSLEMLNPDILISASGDGTIRFWEYLQGKQLAVINTNDYIKDKSLVKQFSELMDKETVDITSLPVTCMKAKLLTNSALIVCSLHNYHNLLVFDVSETGGEICVKLLQIIEFECNPVSFDLADKLYVLTEKNLHLFSFCNDLFTENICNKINSLYENIKDMITNKCLIENISVLYKRKYDNVQEYQERKKLRIETKK